MTDVWGCIEFIRCVAEERAVNVWYCLSSRSELFNQFMRHLTSEVIVSATCVLNTV